VANQLPAFLDALDAVTIWLPDAMRPEQLRSRVTVEVNNKSIAIVSITGRERATQKRDPNVLVLAGTLQAALGGSAWDPSGNTTQFKALSENIFELCVKLPKGNYAYKLARGGSWSENYGAGFIADGPNLTLSIASTKSVRFIADFAKKTLKNSVEHPSEIAAPKEITPQPRPNSLFQSFQLTLARRLTPSELTQPMRIRIDAEPWRRIFAREALSDPQFVYLKHDLGATHTKNSTTFKLWSPVSERVSVMINTKRIPMQRGASGVWQVTVPGDLHNARYQFELTSYGETRRAADIYSVAATADSQYSIVVDWSKTNPPGWPGPRVFEKKQPTDAVIYELHVRDFTIHPSSGVRPAWRGKYLGVGEKCGYLKRLGVTHVHLLPIQNFNAANSKTYNWGYETTLFNTPEEQYATSPDGDPIQRIREVKQMVQALQQNQLGVILDVVYNHTVPSSGALSAFEQVIPYYYFRTNDRGDQLNESGVGNALNDERPMVREYLKNSFAFWSREYKINGFRFDLLGMFTKDTVKQLSIEIKKHNADALIYGEPWTGGGPLRFGKGDQRGLLVGVFNDHFRNAVRGELDGPGPGFAMGGLIENKKILQDLITGSINDFASAPSETVNYVSAHDNSTFWDKVALSLPTEPKLHQAAVKLAHATVIFSQGVVFLEGGIELGRTKQMRDNSYNGGDSINQFDWKRGEAFIDVQKFLTQCLAIRRTHPLFRLRTRAQISAMLEFLPSGPQTIAFRLKNGATVGDAWNEIVVLLHGSKSATELALPTGVWRVAIDSNRTSTQPLRNAIQLAPLSVTVLFQNK
jgi:pullulanase